jgi:hypothetical protein
MAMRRHSLSAKIEGNPWWAQLLHECWNCHAIGLRPGVLETHLGDYEMREWCSGRYSELVLDNLGLCPECVTVMPPEFGSGQVDTEADKKR